MARVLVVDDSATMRKIIIKGLREAGFGELEFAEAVRRRERARGAAQGRLRPRPLRHQHAGNGRARPGALRARRGAGRRRPADRHDHHRRRARAGAGRRWPRARTTTCASRSRPRSCRRRSLPSCAERLRSAAHLGAAAVGDLTARPPRRSAVPADPRAPLNPQVKVLFDMMAAGRPTARAPARAAPRGARRAWPAAQRAARPPSQPSARSRSPARPATCARACSGPAIPKKGPYPASCTSTAAATW